ncbi:shikimate dehydrogenase [Fredinandcohnia quinoae]|uniref:Shikimate dehydrogenase (NADP(+)) n=1 Tax=Fredinandcohnia quinoae TaxID=2918902 RepID=A0AAW5E4V7_9BACI|nr:shikimate dehydrogenase [Fredinandcohnia sp. SECRCQ15]MCH1625011.1 shikimate dehydrogenase [Fredinandcohnia sp. SECRCQ15]
MEKIYGVIGSPISHSMSPQMHNDLFNFYNIHARYHAFHVEKGNVKKAIEGIRALEISGCNITIPHKIEVMEYLDEIEAVAANIGAVNTVVNQDGKLIGYNTDGNGFIRSLHTVIEQSALQHANVLIIGAGGAARAIFISLAASGVKNIDIANRTIEKAEMIISDCQYEVNSVALSMKDAEMNLGKYRVMINTTSIGMSPKVDELPISLQHLSPQSIVSDIIYNPLQTKILIDAREKGAITQNGIGMFVNQGALAFEKWTGIFPDTNRMETTVTNILGGQYANR